MGDNARQFVVYSMSLSADQELAMVLPIPVAAGADENALRFINLEKYPTLFEDLDSGFPRPAPAASVHSRSNMLSAQTLRVLQVGSFEASFVPSVADFKRLDERFRLPAGTFDTLTAYRTFGFAVFKLKPGMQTVHPMAFEFPTALTSRLFFPTVHIHDGKVHKRAGFDHALYCQSTETARLKLLEWEESPGLAGKFVDTKKAKDVVLPREHCYKRELRGTLDNKDFLVEANIFPAKWIP